MNAMNPHVSRSTPAVALVVLMALVAGVGLMFAQTPAPPPSGKAPAQKAQPQPGQPATASPQQPAAPGGIKTLPVPSARESVKPDEVVLTIGPEKITRQRFEQIQQGLPPQYAGVVGQMGERPFASNYAQFRGLALLAEREKLDQTREFQEQINFARMELLARLAINNLQAKSQEISDEEIKKYFEEHKNEYQQAHVRAILVSLTPPAKPAAGGAPAEQSKPRSDAEALARAQEIRKKLLDGADFAATAKEFSDDRNSAEKGGDVGNIRRSQLNPNLDKAIFSLKPNELSEPVKEGPGYYLFKVEEMRPVTADEAAATIRNTLQTQKFEAAMKNVQAQFPVEFNARYFGEAPPANRPVITGVAPGQPGQAAPAQQPPPAKKP